MIRPVTAYTPAISEPWPAGAQPLQLPCGAALVLLPQRAVWWPAARMAFVADLHFGKAATFRRAGQPVPHGTTADNLARLDEVLAATQAGHLVFLGDFLHARSGAAPALWQQLLAWREAHSQVRMTLVRGNHDAHAGDPPALLGIGMVDEPWRPIAGAGVLASHHPRPAPGGTVLAGHWHPTITLRGLARDAFRTPCFVWTQGYLVLPAFGAFTGMSSAPVPRDAQTYAVANGRVLAI